MQPTFLPWAGYFNLIAQADHFVFLDDVQLEKQSWQTRNRLLISGQPHWVSLPIRNTGLIQTIAQTEVVADRRWKGTLAKSFAQAYGRHPYHADASEVISCLLDSNLTQLAELNETVIRYAAKRLGFATNFYRSSTLHSNGERSERLLNLCEQFKVNEYLSPRGAADYLAADGFSARTSVALRFQAYPVLPYSQRSNTGFIPSLSIVDVLANLGWVSSHKYVCQGI